MFGLNKTGPRRAEIRKNRPDAGNSVLKQLQAEGGLVSLMIAAGFCILASGILVLRQNVVRYRPGQFARSDIVARVDFTYRDEKRLQAKRLDARAAVPRVYKLADHDPWKETEDAMLALPDRVKGITFDQLPADLQKLLDPGMVGKLQEYQDGNARDSYNGWVRSYIAAVRGLNPPLIILPDAQYREDLGRLITVEGEPNTLHTESTFTDSERMKNDISLRLNRLANQVFDSSLSLQKQMLVITLAHLGPTHVLDDTATAQARNDAENKVSPDFARVAVSVNTPIVHSNSEITQEDWDHLKDENDQYLRNLGPAIWGERAGLAGIVVLMTVVAGAYIARYQGRIVRNHARAGAIASLMLATLLLAEAAALGPSYLYFFGVAPTILVAMILTIAYDQRFAMGMATFHAVLVALALDANMSFLMILEAGVVTSCFLLDDLRTRSKLIEVGGVTALAMIAATGAAGLIQFDPITFIARNCLYAGAAGLAVGFVVLGILPFIEKAFRITTSMTLLELADASQPLLRRLSLEAPGTYNHSLQVATLSEEAADTIGANSLLCRVGAYYHDIGKINKADYFVENQIDGQNRHINLSPNVSLLIIIGHVKDGIELAREYNLPTSLFPFIQQHHGTTLVEFFFHRACDSNNPDQPEVSDTQYRYPGPKPKTREIAILMLADAVESACRAMSEPTASRIEALVHEISLRRLHDGQFDECDLTMRDLEMIERSLVKTLLGIYHGRIAYPSTSNLLAAPEQGANQSQQAPSIKTA